MRIHALVIYHCTIHRATAATEPKAPFLSMSSAGLNLSGQRCRALRIWEKKSLVDKQPLLHIHLYPHASTIVFPSYSS